jgi:hypothetical protein
VPKNDHIIAGDANVDLHDVRAGIQTVQRGLESVRERVFASVVRDD